MKDFLLLPIGIGDTFTRNLERGNTGFIIISDEQRLLVDCPAYVGALIKKASEKSGFDIVPEEITDIIITHLHDDHINGLAELGYHLYFAKKFETKYRKAGIIPGRIDFIKKPTLHSSKYNLKNLWKKRLQISMGELLVNAREMEYKKMTFQDYFAPEELSSNRSNKVGNLEIVD